MGCSNTKDQPSAVIVSKAKPIPQSSAPVLRQPSAPTRWSPSSHISISSGSARLKPSSPGWSHIWTNLRIPDSFEVTVTGTDVEKLVIGVTEAANRGRADGMKMVKGCEFDVFSFEGVGLVHTQFSEYTYNSEQWKVRAGDTIRVDVSSGVTVTFFKNARKLYTHEDVPDAPLLGFLSLASEQIVAELKN